MRRHAVLASVVLVLGGIAPAPAGAAADDFCSRVSAGVVAGTVADPELIELSGLAASRAHPGVFWANNDSGDSARLFALGADGAALGRFVVAGADATDWEDIAVGPGPMTGTSYIYIGDIGDNAAARDQVTVYRVPEPVAAPAGDGQLDGTETFTIVYPDGPHDAESLLVDPTDGTLAIITKPLLGSPTVFEAAAAELIDSGTTVMHATGQMTVTDTGVVDASAPMNLPGTLVTGADIAPDGSTILVRTYQQVLAFARPDGASIGTTLSGVGCRAPVVAEPQGEAIAFTADGSAYVTAGEVQLAIGQGALPPGSGSPMTEFAIAPIAPIEPTETSEPATAQPTTSALVSSTTTATSATTATTATTATASDASVASVGSVGSSSVVDTASTTVTSALPTQSSESHTGMVVGGVAAGVLAVGAALVVARRRRSM